MFNDVTQLFFCLHIVQTARGEQRVQHAAYSPPLSEPVQTTNFTGLPQQPRKAFSAILLSTSPLPLLQYTFSEPHCLAGLRTPSCILVTYHWLCWRDDRAITLRIREMLKPVFATVVAHSYPVTTGGQAC